VTPNAEFRIFANPMLDRFWARWRKGYFTLLCKRVHMDRVMILTPDDARDLIDALQKFLAVNE
jgi:hypothetical protein